MIGRILNHYKVLEKLGAGEMTEAYVAEGRRLNLTVALPTAQVVFPHSARGGPVVDPRA